MGRVEISQRCKSGRRRPVEEGKTAAILQEEGDDSGWDYRDDDRHAYAK